MADVAVETDLDSVRQRVGPERVGPVWTTADIAYVFYIDSADDLYYRKTVDGGANWAAGVLVDAGTVNAFDIWFDKWTNGDSGTTIHIWWLEAIAADVFYRGLDTSSDTLGSEVTVFDGATFTLMQQRVHGQVSGTKAIGGNLYVQFCGDASGERGFYRSVDSGVNWTARTDGADGDAVDYVLCFPDGDSADNQDIVMLYWDLSADEISIKKYDDSGNSWGETLVSGSMADHNYNRQWDAVVRQSDGHVIVAAWTATDIATADLKIWDITLATPTVTAKTDVITDSDDCIGCALFIDQNNDDLYCAYLGMDDGSQTYTATLDAHYSKSADGGASWGGETTYSADAADDLRGIWSGHSTPGSAAGRYEPVFYNHDLFDLFVNVDNSVEITVSVGAIASQRLKSGTGR